MSSRQILDGVVVADECVHSWNKASVPGLICKLNLEKAYDKGRLAILAILIRMGFGEKWRRWIKECTASACFSILINGSLKGFFHAQRGLRQGDTLSPFLLVNCS